MFPVAATAPVSTSAPPSLVATPLPENFAARVPYTDVPPAVSNVQIGNNARGNGTYTAIDSIAQYPVPVTQGAAATGTAGSITPSQIPAAFLAQMIGQESLPPALQDTLSNVLLSYDQMVRYGVVKHEPSLATLPPPPPLGVFGRILAQETHVEQPVQRQPEQQQVRIEQPQPVRLELPTPQEAPAVQVQATAAPEIKQPTPQERPAPQPVLRKAGTSSVKAAISYLMSEARVDLEAPPAVKASV